MLDSLLAKRDAMLLVGGLGARFHLRGPGRVAVEHGRIAIGPDEEARLLSLAPPFEVPSTAALLSKVEAGEIEPPSARSLAPWPVPRELEAVVAKAMAREQRERYASASELSAEVEAYLSGKRLRETPIESSPSTGGPWVARCPAVSWLEHGALEPPRLDAGKR
ncbi:MAG: hypothetical protein HY720_00625 [Planctomycetes bacterium]|nr:hypothetical protein [Planctomycetota bacterium]